MDNEVLKTLIGMSVSISGFVQVFVKTMIDSALSDAGFSEKTRDAFYTVIRIVISILTVFGAGNELNLLQFSNAYGHLYPAVGLVFTGILVGIGSEALNFVYSLASLKFEVIKAESYMRIEKAEKAV